MNKIKFFILFSLLLFIFVGYRTYEQYNDLKMTEKLILLNESQSLSKFVTAFRQSYQDAFIANHIAVDDKTINLLPVKTISDISKRFSKDVNGEVIIRTVSDRPRNSANMANEFELNEIQYFKDNSDKADHFIQKEGSFYYTKPLYIKENCLKCHGKREETIPSIRDKYTTAYDYKLGDIRGLMNIEIKKRGLFTTLYQDFIENVIATIILYIFFLLIIYFLLYKVRKQEQNYTQQLKQDIQEKTREIEQQKQRLHDQAYHDGLTGLANRILFKDRLKHGMRHAKRHEKVMALFFVDLDNFKEINDSLGHHIGDKVLIETTKRLQSKIREEDTLARLGGDEFTIIMENLDTIHDASVLAEKIQNICREPLIIDAHTFYTTCSIGISFYPQDSEDIDDLLKYADAAMYKAKDEGRNTTRYYSSEMTKLAHERITMQTDLRKALSGDEFILCYQPQIDTKSEKMVGLEALIRWNHPHKGIILPDVFIHIAEETGIIVEIDQWVMKTAMKQIKSWYDQGFEPGVLSLNLTLRQLRSKEYLDVLQQSIKNIGFQPQWLELELTEEQVMKNPKESIVKLEHISNMGINIVIDDFGTGYSSLAYLKRFPVHKLKIDKSFINGITDNKEDEAIVMSIMALSKSLNLKTVAEGVETKEQINILDKLDCNYIQGYFYNKPMSVDEIENTFFKVKLS